MIKPTIGKKAEQERASQVNTQTSPPATPSLRARDRAFIPQPCDCSPSTVRHLIGANQENCGAYRADDGGKSLDRWRWLEHARSRSDSKQRRWQGAQIDARDRPVCKQVGEWGLNAEEDEAMKTRRERPSCVLSPPSPGQRPRGDLAPGAALGYPL